MRLHILLTIFAVVLAGCGGTVQETTETTTTKLATSEITTTKITTEQSEATPTETTTTEVSTTSVSKPNNPWEKEVVTVQVQNIANESRDITPLVREAIDYWENRNNSIYGDPVNYTIKDTYAADIQIKLVEEIPECGYEISLSGHLGCAPLIERSSVVEDQIEVEIASGFTNESTLDTIKHEIGHLRGYDHDDEPQPLMKPEADALTWEEKHRLTKLKQHSYPWVNETLKVSISSDNSLTRSEKDEVQDAFSYYEEGANGWIENPPSFKVISNHTKADIEIHIQDDDYKPCGLSSKAEEGSCGEYIDRAFKNQTYYISYGIHVNGVDDQLIEDHVGYHLGFALGAQKRSDLPEEYQA